MAYRIRNLRQEMKRLREGGMTLQEIADELKTSRTSVRRNLIKIGVSTQNRGWKTTQALSQPAPKKRK